MIKVILFDAIGLITNQEPLSVGLARDYGIPLETSLSFFTGPLQACIAGQADVKEAILPYLKDWGLKENPDTILDYWFERDFKMNTELIHHIQDLRNSGIFCVLGTNNEKYRFAYMSDKMGFNKIFDKAYCSAHLGSKKPSQEFFQKIFTDLGKFNKEEILFWDDKPENIKGARDFGINAELYTSFEDFREKMKQYI